MKIKSDFVTNSSSSSYIIGVCQDDYDALVSFINKLNDDPLSANEGVYIVEQFDNIKDLQEYTNGEVPLDWAQKPRGPVFEYLSAEQYDAALEIIKSDGIAIYASIDREVSRKFEQKWGDAVKQVYYG